MVWLNGIDTVAHQYSYNQLGKTIAVLGNGFHHIFPKENTELYEKILENNGLIVSEYTPDTKYQSNFFLERNRIVSGLSLGVLVIEAAFRSGTSVTSKLAISQNRKVFALPHEIWNSSGVGTNTLIKNGAILVSSVPDILQEFKSLEKIAEKYNDIKKIEINNFYIENKNFDNSNNFINSSSKIDLSVNQKSNFQFKFNYNSIDYSGSSHILEKKKLENPKLAYLYDLISTNPISINEICRKTSKPISSVSSDLFSLELDGYIKKVAGGYICILSK